MRSLFLTAAAATLAAAPALAQGGAIDDFEGGTNDAGWQFNGFTSDILESSGGNPGWWLHNADLFALAPIVSSGPAAGAPWTGDYRAQGVARISLDARTDGPAGMCCREMSLLLRNEMGTPGSTSDDKVAFFVGPAIPTEGAGWTHYDFDVPSASTDPSPPGWFGDNWNDVITNVDVVEVWWMDPRNFAITQTFDVGVDNMEIVLSGVTLGDPSPGLAGQNNTMDLQFAQPFAAVGLGASLATGATNVPCGGATLVVDLQNPTVLQTLVTDGAGAATFQFFVPAGVSGRTANFQAVDLGGCAVSNLVTYAFP